MKERFGRDVAILWHALTPSPACYKFRMPSFRVETPGQSYSVLVERGAAAHLAEVLPPKRGKVFVVSTEDVWRHQGALLADSLRGVPHEVLFLPGRRRPEAPGAT